MLLKSQPRRHSSSPCTFVLSKYKPGVSSDSSSNKNKNDFPWNKIRSARNLRIDFAGIDALSTVDHPEENHLVHRVHQDLARCISRSHALPDLLSRISIYLDALLESFLWFADATSDVSRWSESPSYPVLRKLPSLFLSLFLSCSSVLSRIKDRAFAYNAGRDACDLHSEQDRLWLCTSCIRLFFLSPSPSSAVSPFSSLCRISPRFLPLQLDAPPFFIPAFLTGRRERKKRMTKYREWGMAVLHEVCKCTGRDFNNNACASSYLRTSLVFLVFGPRSCEEIPWTGSVSLIVGFLKAKFQFAHVNVIR